MMIKNKKKTLLIIGPRSIGGEEGGIESQIFNLLPYFSRYYRVEIFIDKRFLSKSLRNIQGIRGEIYLHGVISPSSKVINKVWISFIATMWALINKIDIIYYNGLGSALFLFLLYLKKSVKKVVHVRSYDVLYPDWNIIGKMIFAFIILEVRYLSDKVICVNEIFSRMFKKSIYIPNTIPSKKKCCKEHLRMFEEQYGFKLQEEKYVLFIGRITPFKNVQLLIKAFLKSRFSKKGKMLIAGQIDDKKYFIFLKKISEGKKNIVFLGKVDKVFVPCLYKYAKLMVLPSLYEGMPNVVLESCIYDIPTYVSDISPHKSLFFLEKDAFFTDIEDLSYKIDHPKKTCMKERLSLLSPEIIARRILDVFDN